MVVVLFPVSDDGPRLERAALEELARLGVTSIALLRDPTLAGLVLEGWGFDLRDAQRAAHAVSGFRQDIRMLQPLVQMAVSPAAAQQASRKE